VDLTGFFAATFLKLPFLPSMLFAMLTAALAGMIIERLAYRPLRRAPRIAALITAIGISFFLQYTLILFISPQPRTFPAIFTSEIYQFYGVIINNQQIVIFLVTILLMALLTYIVQYTKAGKAMRAVSFDADAARLMGINVDNTISITFAIGCALAAIGAVFYAQKVVYIRPMLGSMPGLKAFVAAVLGGIGIIPGAVLGGFLIGIAETFMKYYASEYVEAMVFGILILVLLFKPSGIMGRKSKEKV
jgi:branched-chain amino acid transport system permease protein